MTGNSRSFYGAVGLTFICLLLANVLSYLFQLSMGRFFDPHVFSEIQSLLGLFMLVAVPATSFSMLVTRQTSERLSLGLGTSLRGFTRSIYWALTALTLILVAGAWMLSDPLARSLSVREPLSVTLLALCIGLSFFQLATGSTLQGFQDFLGFNGQQLVATALKCVTLFIALALLPTSAGVLAGVAASAGLAALFAHMRAQKHFNRVQGENVLQKIQQGSRFSRTAIVEAAVVLLANLGLAVLTQADVIYSHRSFSSEIAASFAATVMIAKALTYIPTALTIVLFPRVTQLAQSGESQRELARLVWRSLGITLLAVIAGVAVLSVFESLIHWIVFSRKFPHFEELLPHAALAYFPSALTLPILQILIALKSPRVWIVPSLAALAFLGVLAVQPLDVHSLLYTIAGFSTLTLVGLTVELWQRLR
jgi:O-antigen/teichoic acid export membrane protein